MTYSRDVTGQGTHGGLTIPQYTPRTKRPNEHDFKSFLRYAAQFFISEGRLHHHGGHTQNKFHQLVVWEMDREKVLHGVHEEMGHKGLYPMRHHLINQFWWPSVFKDVKAWVRGCHHCQIFSRRKVPIPIKPSSLFQLFHVIFMHFLHAQASWIPIHRLGKGRNYWLS